MTTVRDGWNGRFLEDFTVGDLYRCTYGRTITESDNIQFTLLTNNSNQIHFNREYGKKTEFGQCLVNSALTLSVIAGMSVADVSQNGVNLGWGRIDLPNPVFPGDTLYSESEVLSVRDSKSKPGVGILEIRTRGYSQRGTLVIEFERTIMVWKREHAPVRDSFPVNVETLDS